MAQQHLSLLAPLGRDVVDRRPLVSVAVPVPRLGLLTYRAPADRPIAPGMRVRVPLGARVVTGWVVAVVEQERVAPAEAGGESGAELRAELRPGSGPGPAVVSSAREGAAKARGGLKDVLEILDTEPFFPEEVLTLALWTASYYLCGPGETIAAAAPPLARGERSAFKQQRVARLTDSGAAAALATAAPSLADDTADGAHDDENREDDERDEQDPRVQPDRGDQRDDQRDHQEARVRPLTEKQRDVLAALSEAPEGIALAALARQGRSNAVLAGLARRGLVVIEDEVVERDPFGDEALRRAAALPSPLDVVLTADQQLVFDQLATFAAARRFETALLHGVTGSGKTQIYLRLADAVRRQGRRVLMLVPEISLTPAMAAIFRRAFGERVAIQHSGLSDGERHDQWHRIRRGDIDIVVGTRSAVFTPLASIGLIVVDEEHDTSYKQEESPRYHGRDVAVMRAKQAHALVLLGSATPSLETYQHALTGRYRHLVLARRILDRPLATVRTVNMRDEYALAGPDVILSAALREALQLRFDAGEQSLILLNRRGYANAIFCRQCAATLECPNCSVTLTIHRTASRARCHYCDHEARVPRRCVQCGGEYLEYRGFGTERIEADVRAAWPQARVARVDRDTVRRRGAIARLLDRFAGRELDVLIGTQMIAKGHDFPEVTLVGVVSADIGLGVADFRAAERTFQLLTQVVGRAGRGARQGEAIIQTLYPDHFTIVQAARQDYRAFYDREALYRRGMHYPPSVSMINVIVRGPSLDGAMADAQRLAKAVARHDTGAELKGPAQAPLTRLRGDYRAQFFLKGTRRAAMRHAVTDALARHPEIARRASVDVDPLSML